VWCMKLFSIKCLFTPNGLRRSEIHPFYSNTTICPKISNCVAPNVFAISLSHLFSKENQVHNYMHARIKFHAYSWHNWITKTISRKKKGRLLEYYA
jgi:hypothetical protein